MANSEFIEKYFGEVFEIISGKDIDDKIFYNNPGKIPVVSGQTSNKGIRGFVDEKVLLKISKVIKNEAITITKDGIYSGKMFYRNFPFFLGGHCHAIVLKEEWKGKINLLWFYYTHQPILFENVISKAGNGSLPKEILFKIKLKIPIDVKFQEKLVEKYSALKVLEEKIKKIIKNINFLFSEISYDTVSEEILLSDVFYLIGGNSGLTEELIYNNPPRDKKSILNVYSGSTTKKSYLGGLNKEVRINNSPIKIFEGPKIVVTRKGNAGTMKYRNDSFFAINDDAYVLDVKKESKNKIDESWFYYSNPNLFKTYSTSKEGNGTFSKEILKNIKLKVPSIEIQKKLSKKFCELNEIKTKLKEIKDTISLLLDSILKI